jgi:DNA-binding transcriptional regulator GbsR (MarR family)
LSQKEIDPIIKDQLCFPKSTKNISQPIHKKIRKKRKTESIDVLTKMMESLQNSSDESLQQESYDGDLDEEIKDLKNRKYFHVPNNLA